MFKCVCCSNVMAITVVTENEISIGIYSGSRKIWTDVTMTKKDALVFVDEILSHLEKKGE